jgi:hypothetical protein
MSNEGGIDEPIYWEEERKVISRGRRLGWRRGKQRMGFLSSVKQTHLFEDTKAEFFVRTERMQTVKSREYGFRRGSGRIDRNVPHGGT